MRYSRGERNIVSKTETVQHVLPDKVKIATQLELLALSDPDHVINPSEASEALRIKYHTVSTTISRLLERQSMVEVDIPASRVVETVCCPTCGTPVDDESQGPAGPPRKYFQITSARAEEMAVEWPDDRVDQMIEALESRAIAAAEAKGLNKLIR